MFDQPEIRPKVGAPRLDQDDTLRCSSADVGRDCDCVEGVTPFGRSQRDIIGVTANVGAWKAKIAQSTIARSVPMLGRMPG